MMAINVKLLKRSVFLYGVFSCLLVQVGVAQSVEKLTELYLNNFDRLNKTNNCLRGLKNIQESFFNTNKPIMVAAHRGDHMEAPENSIPSFEDAVNYGTAIIEIDVRNSSDDSLMVIHDNTVDRTTTGQGRVNQQTFCQLRSYHLINKYDGSETEFIIPSLFETLLGLKGKVMIDLDIKCNKIEKIFEIVQKLDMLDQCIFFCDEADMDYVLSKAPDALLMPRAKSYEQLEKLMRKYKPSIIHIDDRNFEIPKAVELIHSIQPKTRVWANSLGARDWKAIRSDDTGVLELVSLGIDVIQTDIPRYVGYLVCEQ